MADAMIFQVVDQVVAAIRAVELATPVNVVVDVLPGTDIKDLDGIQVTVVPTADDSTLVARGGAVAMHDYSIDVGIQRRLPAGNLTRLERLNACKPLIALTREIADALLGTRILTGAILSAAIRPLYSVDHLAQLGVFTSVIQLTVKMGQ